MVVPLTVRSYNERDNEKSIVRVLDIPYLLLVVIKLVHNQVHTGIISIRIT